MEEYDDKEAMYDFSNYICRITWLPCCGCSLYCSSREIVDEESAYGRMSKQINSEYNNNNNNSILLTVPEVCTYLNIGKTKCREIMADPHNGFTVRIGNKLYAHKQYLDKWLEKQILNK